jgi:membrane-associated protease RseP (regulator of RpoE activity)
VQTDPLTPFLVLFGIYIVVYVIAQWIGFEKLSERGLEAGTPFFVMFKTERLNNFLTKWGKKVPRAFFNLGIVVGFAGMAGAFWLFGSNFLNFFFAPEAAGGVVPIIPGITITGLPLVYMLIGLAITIILHEFAHGLASSKDDITIKSSGLLFFLILFGAFVEPDEEEFENKATPRARMRMLAAGSFMNLIGAFVTLLIIANFNPIMSVAFNPPSGAFVYDLEPDSPAASALQVGDVIIGLNDTTIETWADVSTFMVTTESNSSLTVYTLDGSHTITLGQTDRNASKGYMGVFGSDYWEPKPGWEWIPGGPMYAFHIQLTLTWTFLIIFSVALFNLMPIPALDGDKLLSNGLGLIIKDERKIKAIMWPARIISLVIILLSIVFSLLLGRGLF